MGDKILPRVYRGQPMFCCQIRDLFSIRNGQWALRDGESTATRLSCHLERAFEFGIAAYLHGMKLETQFSCWELALFPLLCRDWILWIPQHGHAGELGNGFLE